MTEGYDRLSRERRGYNDVESASMKEFKSLFLQILGEEQGLSNYIENRFGGPRVLTLLRTRAFPEQITLGSTTNSIFS